jgi:hypothetical protein
MLFNKECRLCKSSLHNFLWSFVALHLGPYVFITLYCFSQCDHILHPLEVRGKSTALGVLIFMAVGRRWGERRLWTEWLLAFPIYYSHDFHVSVLVICLLCQSQSKSSDYLILSHQTFLSFWQFVPSECYIKSINIHFTPFSV